jgi:hypothetical protein
MQIVVAVNLGRSRLLAARARREGALPWSLKLAVLATWGSCPEAPQDEASATLVELFLKRGGSFRLRMSPRTKPKPAAARIGGPTLTKTAAIKPVF